MQSKEAWVPHGTEADRGIKLFKLQLYLNTVLVFILGVLVYWDFCKDRHIHWWILYVSQPKPTQINTGCDPHPCWLTYYSCYSFFLRILWKYSNTPITNSLDVYEAYSSASYNKKSHTCIGLDECFIQLFSKLYSARNNLAEMKLILKQKTVMLSFENFEEICLDLSKFPPTLFFYLSSWNYSPKWKTCWLNSR